MAVKIRLMRIGAKKRPFYRIVAVDEKRKRTGGYLELLGTYNPLTQPKEINIQQDKVDAWVKNGAILSDGYLRIIGKAPQKPARKPKKDHGGASAPAAAAPAESTSEEQPATEEAPTEEVATEQEEATPVEEVNEAPAEETAAQEEEKAE